jgi:hypothetical protein
MKAIVHEQCGPRNVLQPKGYSKTCAHGELCSDQSLRSFHQSAQPALYERRFREAPLRSCFWSSTQGLLPARDEIRESTCKMVPARLSRASSARTDMVLVSRRNPLNTRAAARGLASA